MNDARVPSTPDEIRLSRLLDMPNRPVTVTIAVDSEPAAEPDELEPMTFWEGFRIGLLFYGVLAALGLLTGLAAYVLSAITGQKLEGPF